MTSETQRKKPNKGGEIMRYEPQGMVLLNSCPGFVEVFKREGYLKFWQQLQGHHVEVAYKLVLNYNGTKSRVGDLDIPVSEQSILAATWILTQGERWFKGMSVEMTECGQFFKDEHQDIKLNVGAQRGCMTKERDDC